MRAPNTVDLKSSDFPELLKDPWLIAGTGVMGVPWAVEYLLHRSVLPLGLYHGSWACCSCLEPSTASTVELSKGLWIEGGIL